MAAQFGAFLNQDYARPGFASFESCRQAGRASPNNGNIGMEMELVMPIVRRLLEQRSETGSPPYGPAHFHPVNRRRVEFLVIKAGLKLLIQLIGGRERVVLEARPGVLRLH